MTAAEISRVIRAGTRLTSADRSLAMEAMIALALARIVFLILPFPAALAWFQLRRKTGDGDRPRLPNPSEASSLTEIAQAIRRSSRVAPFRAVCLQEAMAAVWMLRRRGLWAEVYFGVAKDTGKLLSAHAWSISMGTPITGWRGVSDYTGLVVFTTK